MKTACWLVLLTFSCLTAARSARAHPVAQGALDVQILPGAVRIQARVTGEEIFVANTFSPSAGPKAGNLDQVWQRHGQYLLRHLKVLAGEHALTGSITSVSPAQNDFVVYKIEFAGVASPSQLRIEEDLLNEIEYAPGNPWEAAFITRIRQQDRPAQEGLLLSRTQPLIVNCDWNATTPAASTGLNKTRMVQQFVRAGIGHILTGYDHLLFIIALILTAATFWDLVKVITAFTLAHTITLTLSVLNIVRLPSHIVEPMIAGSIVFVALTNLFWPKNSRGRVRLATAFFFGLFHGLGFAGGLLSAMDGMNGVAVGVAIAAFSLGVELGHQMVVLPLFSGLKLARVARDDEAGRERLTLAMMRGGSLLISIAGTIYLVAALK
jgi:hydrogenase/urease accessory protein HupE